MIFDPTIVDAVEKEPTILGFLIHSSRINQEFDQYLSVAIEDLDPLSGQNLQIFYLDSVFKKETWSRTEVSETYPIGLMTPGMKLKPIRTRRKIDEQVFLMDVGRFFLEGDFVKMPSVVFFESFSSDSFNCIELKDRSGEEVSNFILECAKEASSIWGEIGCKTGSVTPNDRKNAFAQFEPFLNKGRLWRRAKRVAQNTTILTMASTAASLV
ncbi:MAG: hypothetical protein GJ676_05825 [Rhodobacteraceae bacterium]|nr:hypothetical protein [Paracoccaceae bacterium]